MEFYEVLNKRRSIRSYKNDPISKESLDRIAGAVQVAPSACNLQPWSFRIVLSSEIREKICQVYDRDWLQPAPAIVVALGNKEEAWQRLEGKSIIDVDLGIAMEHLVLAAAAEGLGTCWVCAYEVQHMDRTLGITAPWSTVAISPLGYPAKMPSEIKRKPIEDIFKIMG